MAGAPRPPPPRGARRSSGRHRGGARPASPAAGGNSPEVTTRSPAAMPCATTARPSCDGPDLQIAHLRLAVLADDIGIEAVGAALHGDVGYHDDVVQRLDEQTRRDGQRRPQLVIRVGKLGLEADGAGRRVDLVVDQRQCASVELGLAVGRIGDDRQRPRIQRVVDARKLLLGRSEDDGDRLDLRDRRRRRSASPACTMLP